MCTLEKVFDQVRANKIRSLRLDNDSIGHKYPTKLARCLAVNSSLERLHLNKEGNIRTNGIVSICEGISQMPARLKSFAFVGTWSRNHDVERKAETAVAKACRRHSQSLEKIDFSNNKTSTTMIATALRSCLNVTHINLSNTTLDLDGIRCIVDNMISRKTSLQCLNLSKILKVAGEGLKCIAESFKHNSTLEKLILSHCGVTDVGAFNLAKGIRQTMDSDSETTTNLSILDLSHNNIDEPGARALFRLVTKLCNFKRRHSRKSASLYLDLDNCHPLQRYKYQCFDDENTSYDMSATIDQCCEIQHKIGEGSFGQIYMCNDRRNSQSFALKIEDKKRVKPQLSSEFQVYQILHESGQDGFPRVSWGLNCGNKVLMGMSLLGENLEDLFTHCGREFTHKTVAMIAIQLLHRFESMHNNSLIHRDIKPGNFMTGVHQNSNMIYAIDMGLSRQYRNKATGEHNPMEDGKSLTGTPRYASINAHRGLAQSRRDDLESLAYMSVYFIEGRLPWQGTAGGKGKGERNKKIGETKARVSVNELCANCPVEIASFLNYARNLEFDETPDYKYCRRLFTTLLKRHGFVNDGLFDWCPIPLAESTKSSHKENHDVNLKVVRREMEEIGKEYEIKCAEAEKWKSLHEEKNREAEKWKTQAQKYYRKAIELKTKFGTERPQKRQKLSQLL